MRKPLLAVLAAAIAAQARAATLSIMTMGRASVAPHVSVVTLSLVDKAALDVSRADLMAMSEQRAARTLSAVQKLAGEHADVSYSVSVTRDKDERTGAVRGRTVTRTIEVTLRGKKAMEAKLAKLYENADRAEDSSVEPIHAGNDKARKAFFKGLDKLTRWQTGSPAKKDAAYKAKAREVFLKNLEKLTSLY